MQSSDLRLWLLRKTLSLPVAVLRALSGGGVIYRQGRTLDPQIQFLWRAWLNGVGTRAPLSVAGREVETARAEWLETAAFLAAPRHLKLRFETIGGEGAMAPVSGLVITPALIASDAPLLVFFPQGGGVLGGPPLSRAFCSILAAEARMPVFVPDLRLAPVHRFPAALDDARAALEWAQANAVRLGAPQGTVAVGGALTGAALAARLCLDLKRAFKPLPVAQLLVTPLLDLAAPVDAAAGVWPLTAADIEVLVAHYAGAGTDLTDPRVSPAREPLLTGQPVTFIVSAGLDPLAGQAEAFARRLIAARTATVYRRHDTLPLGFDLFPGVVDGARSASADIARTFVELLRTRHPAPDDAAAA